jgi:6-phosphogluconolactonase (cycloisomerase 2 family)
MSRKSVVAFVVALVASFAAATVTASATTTRCCMPWQAPGNIEVSPDGTHLYVSDPHVLVAARVDRSTGELSAIDTYDSVGSSIEMPPDARHLYVAGGNYPRFSAFARDTATGALTPIAAPDLPEDAGDMVSSPDGRQLYIADRGNSAVIVFDRDPETGALTRRGSVPVPLVGGRTYKRLGDLVIAPGGTSLYLAVDSDSETGVPERVVWLDRGADGALTVAGETGCDWCGGGLVVSPDGKHVIAPTRAYTFDRDPATGVLSNGRDNSDGGVGADGAALSPDGTSLYRADFSAGRMFASTVSPAGTVTRQAVYREAVDNFEGLRHVQTVAVAPAGDFVFAASGGSGMDMNPGRIASYRRDTSNGLLTFADVIDGPNPRRPGPGPGGPPGLGYDPDTWAPSITINGGAEYTNDRDVTVTISGASYPLAIGVVLSNDGGFGPGTEKFWPTENNVYRWRLATSGPERMPKTVYTQLIGPMSAVGTFVDDIVLDERDPTVQYVEATVPKSRTAKRMKLKVRARDSVSGLGRMQVTTNKKRPGAWKKYTSRPELRRTARPVWVRVRDRAGNPSRWQQAKVRR